MAVEIYHNPKCSKSRQTLALLEKKGLPIQVRLYLEDPPKKSELQGILKKLGLQPLDLIRTGEDLYKELVSKKGKPDQKTALDWLISHPKLIERPIVIKGNKARIGRPPEQVLEIL